MGLGVDMGGKLANFEHTNGKKKKKRHSRGYRRGAGVVAFMFGEREWCNFVLGVVGRQGTLVVLPEIAVYIIFLSWFGLQGRA